MFLIDAQNDPYPVGLLSSVLSRHIVQLQTLSFLDNEYGQIEKSKEVLRRCIIVPVNLSLRRMNKKVTLVAVEVCDKAHHQVVVRFNIQGNSGTGSFKVSLFPESIRQKAAQREREAEGTGVGAPSRGKPRPKVPKKKKLVTV